MDGAFFYELFLERPVDAPVAWATRFYLQYPAVSVLFYPPLFAIVEAVFFMLTGPSHFSAQLTVAVFFFFLAAGAYRMTRAVTDSACATALALMLVSCHETAFWGRQVMLEIPAYALLVWSADAFCRYFRCRQRRYLYLATGLYVLSMATKLNSLFLLPVFLSTLAWGVHRKVVSTSDVAACGTLFLLLAAPMLCCLLHFGQVNVGAVLGGQAAGELSRLSLQNWLFYARALPAQLGPVVSIAVCILAVTALGKGVRRGEPHLFLFLFSWLLWGYLFFSLVALKEQRHGIFIIFPLLFLLVYAFHLNRKGAFPRSVLQLFGVASLIYALWFDPVFAVKNFPEAADYVARNAPQQSRVLINSRWDGNFIFNMWLHRERKDLAVLRSDKLLLELSVKRSMGVFEHHLADDQILDMLDCYGVGYIVHEKGFWVDLDSMARLQALLESERFQRVKRIRIDAGASGGGHLEIYRNTRAILDRPIPIEMALPIIGKRFKGVLP